MTAHAEAQPKGRDIAPTGVRLPPDLRDQLLREARINGRSLSAEITVRLLASVNPYRHLPDGGLDVREPPPAMPAAALSDAARQLLTLFNALPPEKQLALLTFLRR